MTIYVYKTRQFSDLCTSLAGGVVYMLLYTCHPVFIPAYAMDILNMATY